MVNSKFNIRLKQITKDYKYIYLLIFIIAFASFFMQWANLTPPVVDGVVSESYTQNVHQIITQSYDFTTSKDIGIFSDMNHFSGLMVLYLIPILSLIAFVLIFFKNSFYKKIINWVTAILFLIAPIFFIVNLRDSISLVNEIDIATIGFGTILCFLAGIVLIALLIVNKDKTVNSYDYFQEKEHKLKSQYLIVSIIALIGMLVPFIKVFIPSGLRKTLEISMNLVELIRISDTIKIVSIFSRFGSEIGMGFAAIFYLIPLIALVTIVSVFHKKHLIRRALALLNSILMISAPIIILTLISDNIPMIEGTSKASASIGYYFILLAGVFLFYIFVSDKRETGYNPVSISFKNHRISYITLSLIACLILVIPLTGVSAEIAQRPEILGEVLSDGMVYSLSLSKLVSIFNGGLIYIMYLIPLLALTIIVAVTIKYDYLKKILSYILSALLIIGPIVIYTKISTLFGELGIVKLKFSSILFIIIGISLLITTLTDRKVEIEISNVWKRVKKVFELITTALFAVVQLYPLIWLFLSSFKNNSEIFSGKVLALPKVWNFANYSRVMFGAGVDETIKEAIARSMARQKDMTVFKFLVGGGSEGNIIRYFMNSAFVVIATVAVVILFGAMASYAISRLKWKRSSLFFTIFMLGMMIPVHVALSPLYVTFAKMNLIDSLMSLIIPYIGFGLPIAIIVISGFMESIPYEIEESARIDGANIFTVFFKIIIPMVMPAISTVLIFVFLQSWNELMFATSFINSGVKRTITVGINSIAKSQYNTEYALIFAGLVIASLPTILIYLAGSQQVQKSLIVGAVKG